MTIRVALEHRTSYHFDRPVTVHPHVVRLRPAPHCRTPIRAYSLTVTPAEHFVNWQQDAFGNHLARFVFPEKARELSFVVDLIADMTVINPFDFFVEDYAERFPFAYPPGVRADLEPYLRPVDERQDEPGSGPGPLLRDWLAAFGATSPIGSADGQAIVDFLVDVNQRVSRDIAYTTRLEPGVQSPDHTLTAALGSCRDSAWLLVAVLRELGLAARFVSGYLVQLTADVKPLTGAAGPSADFTDLHAWAEVYVPGAGWVGLDATSGLFAGEGHIPLSATPHPATSAPIMGSVDPCEVTFDFSNTVTRVHEDPRVTLPYSQDQWERVDAVGRQVDELLTAADVRLTMGGEPTFVSVDDMESAQWNTAADGEDKRRLAADLAERLATAWAPGGVLHHGQGKWYPGEPLPRWQLSVTWRADGEPLWRDPALLAAPWGPPPHRPGSPAAARASAEIAAAVAAQLGVPHSLVLPAYEDTLHTLWDEALRPAGMPPSVDADPDDPALANVARRTELVNALDSAPGRPKGWVVPLFRAEDDQSWGSSRWHLRRRHLFLVPGTSPLGLRLPLASIAWGPPPDTYDRSGFEPRAALPPVMSSTLGAPRAGMALSFTSNTADDAAVHAALSTDGRPDGEAQAAVAADRLTLRAAGIAPATIVDVEQAPRTALCVEERGGHVFVFLPPLTRLEDGVVLLAAVENAAAAAGTPVVLEGYPLPGDPRTRTVSVTPDPGVIEVNLQPCASWDELATVTGQLYQHAHEARLATEKFDLDGLHTGTGGGNHITLGGATPADSPLLRRPDLLRSMVTYWQHHPSLSYLFSGRFIGPTSQAPRVDEARPETLYELEIAFAELDKLSGEPRPWLVDRLLRHLLTDVTGNTHRAEFCIDKMYSPDGERGRLGLLELRGFEMPPHPRMGLVQALLVRALVARFWADPYGGPLVRWGTQLHDRFLLPAFAAADVSAVVDDLRDHGIAFEQAWLDPFLEFRFPRLGEVEVDGVHLELRGAVEPWNVLGEEVAGSGTSRYVDSSVERVQVLAAGLVAGRHVVTCNRIPVPLTATGTAGTAVGGVRYRAWAPPSALHPTIGVHSPLVFDLVDLWNSRSLGGFTHHVVHPGGRSYERYPVNAAEAEARRGVRFVPSGHTPGRIDTSAWRVGRDEGTVDEYPRTLDLRRTHARPA